MKQPTIAKEVYLAPGAAVVGDVTLSAGASVWYSAVVRADSAPITIGPATNIQDGCVLHVDPGHPLVLGAGVSVGHGAILHGCEIGANTVVGMGAIMLNGCKVGENCLIGAGALLTENTVIPAGWLAFGSPAKPLRPLRAQEIEANRQNALHYLALGREMTV